MTTKAKDDGKVTYLLSRTDDTKTVIRVPSNWKVTFSAGLNPTEQHRNFRHDQSAGCVRIYESKEQQRGVFLGVTEMICVDLIEIENFEKKTYYEYNSESGPEGRKERSETRHELVKGPEIDDIFL